MLTTFRQSAGQRLPHLLNHPLLWFAGALVVYILAAGRMWDQQSLAPHYIHLADSLLHGRLDLMHTDNLYDLLVTDGRAYVAGSPLPAVVLAPVIFLLGNEFSDILFSIVVGAINVGLVQFIFRRPWLTLLFALASPHLYMAPLGSVWLQAHLVALLFALPALYFGWKRQNWLLAGLLLGLAGLARPSLWFGAAFFGLYIWLTQEGAARRAALTRFALPLAAGVGLHLLYNAARFGGLLDFGYQYTAGASNVIAVYAEYGAFHPRFLPCNLYISLLNPPLILGQAAPGLRTACSYLLNGVAFPAGAAIAPNPLGTSLLLATPAFLLLLAARRRTPAVLAGWAGLLAIMLPLWAYHNTGSVQFSYRYWMDAAPFWLLLLGVTYPLPQPSARLDALLERLRLPLLALSILINFWGFLWIYRLFVGQSWVWSWVTWLRNVLF